MDLALKLTDKVIGAQRFLKESSLMTLSTFPTRKALLVNFQNFMMFLFIWLSFFLVTVPAARIECSLRTVGIRSALMGSIQHYHGKCSKAKHKVKKQHLEIGPDTFEVEEPNAAETAFFKQSSIHDLMRQQTAQTAYLKRKTTVKSKRHRRSSSLTELEFLEQGSSGGLIDYLPARTDDSHSSKITLKQIESSDTRGGASTKASSMHTRPLVFWENMICGAISRSIAQTVMHPANTMKTILQNSRSGVPDTPTIRDLLLPQNFHRLTVGAGANFILSVPHGAVNFAVLEYVRKQLSHLVQTNPVLAANEKRFGFGLDFLSSSISTIVCSVVSTPQMMITDNIMAGNYPNLRAACVGLARTNGISGFYSGWWPGLVGKIPSYALTWTFFQQLKTLRNHVYSTSRPIATNAENTIMGCIASATTVCLMIPMDTIKTRRTLILHGSRLL
jgi:Mitochondrial carrier protein